MPNSQVLPDQDITKPTGTATNIPQERQQPNMQETHPSMTSHEPGELGRAAITEETKRDSTEPQAEPQDDSTV